MQILVIGATGMVGRHILALASAFDHPTFALSRASHDPTPYVQWLKGDLSHPNTISFPRADVIYCTTNANLLAAALPRIIHPGLRRVVLFTSTSLVTKIDSEVSSERVGLRQLAEGERNVISICERAKVDWTVLRPTMIYDEGIDINITRLARLIKRLGFIPVAGQGRGLRQPVHAQDLAKGAIAAASCSAAANKIYALPGGETITYHEMVGRIFDGLERSRHIIRIPLAVWALAFTAVKALFPRANVAMGKRMDSDMVFDIEPARADFGWDPRSFRPTFARNL